MLLHDRQELDDDLGRGADHDLALAALLRVHNRREAVVEHTNADHSGVGCGVVVSVVGYGRSTNYLRVSRVGAR